MTLLKALLLHFKKIRSTRKQFIVGNPNPEGYIGANLPKNQLFINDVARTTIKVHLNMTMMYDYDQEIDCSRPKW